MPNPFATATMPTENHTKRVKSFDLGNHSKGLQKLGAVDIPDYFFNRYSFGVEVMNSLINGDGLMKSQVCTVASPRGAGKTTLLMSMLQKLIEANKGLKCGYLSNEECIEQLAFAAQRIGATEVMADNTHDIDDIADLMEKMDVLVIDSFPGLTHKSLTHEKQIEQYAINTLVKKAKTTGCSLFFVMHYTKDGKEAGSKNVFHAVDTCITIDKLDIETYGENCRLIEVSKNRFGSQAEVILRLTREGFDFSSPVEEKTGGNDCNKNGGVYVHAKMRDSKTIIDIIKSKGATGGAKLQDFADTGIDIGRIERLLKDMVNLGRVVATGGGKGQPRESKRWHMGDSDDDDEDQEAA